MDNSNTYGLAPELDSPTLYNIVRRDRYHVVILQNIALLICFDGITSEEYEVANAWRPWQSTCTSEDGRYILQSLRALSLQ